MAAVGLPLLTFSGCVAVKPRPFTPAAIDALADSDRADARRGIAPIEHPLTLDEAIARAFKYNLDQRARSLELALAQGVADAGRYDLLPRAMAMAGYRERNDDLISRSKDSVTGAPSLAHPYISSARSYGLYEVGATWNLLDVAVGYYTAKQNADRILIAAEHRRKALHTLARDVTAAFWKAASAQRLSAEVHTTIAAAEAALADAAASNAEALRSPTESLRYQRQLLESIRLLTTIEKDLANARTTLCLLINVPLDAAFELVEPAYHPAEAILAVPVEQLEETALRGNADYREKLYDHRIAVAEARKSLAKLLPSLGLSTSLKHSTDPYLINQTWQEAGVQVSANLLNLISAPAQKRLADSGVDLAHQRRIAAQMALLAQVHIARIDLEAARKQFLLADRIGTLDEALRTQAANRREAHAESRLAAIAADATAIVSALRRNQALIEVSVAESSLQTTLGLEPELGDLQALPLDQVVATVTRWQQAWRDGQAP